MICRKPQGTTLIKHFFETFRVKWRRRQCIKMNNFTHT